MEEVMANMTKPSNPALAIEMKDATLVWDAPTSVGPEVVSNGKADGKPDENKTDNKSPKDHYKKGATKLYVL